MEAKKIVSIPIKYLYDDMMTYIKEKGTNSENTKEAYLRDIRQFCESVFEKQMEFVTEDDITSLNNRQVLKYKQDLIAQNYSPTTVNVKISLVRSLFKKMKIDYPDIRPEVFEVDRVKETVNSYGDLLLEEANNMVELAKGLSNGEAKSVLIELAKDTSIRLDALINLKLSNIIEIDGFKVVCLYDKGKKLDQKPITDDLYNRIVALGREDLFDFTSRTIQRDIKTLCDMMGIDHTPQGRNITFHSLKKVAINWVLDTTGDVTKGAEQGNHSNIQTTYKHYKRKTKNFGTMAGITMNNPIDLSKLEDLSKEELIQLITSCSLSTKFEVSNKLKG